MRNGMRNGMSNGMRNGMRNGLRNGTRNGMMKATNNDLRNGITNEELRRKDELRKIYVPVLEHNFYFSSTFCMLNCFPPYREGGKDKWSIYTSQSSP